MKHSRLFFFGALVLVFSAACGMPPTTLSKVDKIKTKTCTYDFEVEVTQGPNAKLKLRGKLALLELPSTPGTLFGTFYPGGKVEKPEDAIPVSGSFSKDSVSVQFALKDGKKIVGYGPLVDGKYCDKIEGIALGPTTSKTNNDPATFDQGHWVSYTSTTLTLDGTFVAGDYAFDDGSGLTGSSSEFTTNACTSSACGTCLTSTAKNCRCLNSGTVAENNCIKSASKGCDDATGSSNALPIPSNISSDDPLSGAAATFCQLTGFNVF